jgi:hypothetical protein
MGIRRSRREIGEGSDAMPDELLTLAVFSDKLGHAFVLDEPEAPPIELKLTEAKPIANYAKAAREPFSLLFTTEGVLLPQRLYQLRHEALGTLGIFIVPVAQVGGTVTYQAIFN